jgi:hypothetical protein
MKPLLYQHRHRHHHLPLMVLVLLKTFQQCCGGDLQIPFTLSPFDSTDHLEKSPKQVWGNCVRTGYDAQLTADPQCQEVDECHLAFTEPAEYLMYQFVYDRDAVVWDSYNWEETVLVDVTLRVASSKANKRIKLVIENDVDDERYFRTTVLKTPGKGMKTFDDILWPGVALSKNTNIHRLYVYFPDGNVNLCSVSVKTPRIAPFRAPALDFDRKYRVMVVFRI